MQIKIKQIRARIKPHGFTAVLVGGDFGNPDIHHFLPTIFDWIITNMGPYDIDRWVMRVPNLYTIKIYFADGDDAMRFKLQWG